MVDRFTVSVKLAGMLLLDNGQISVREIECLPLVKNRQEANAIAHNLMEAMQPKFQISVTAGVGQTDTRLSLSSGFRPGRSRASRLTHTRVNPNPVEQVVPTSGMDKYGILNVAEPPSGPDAEYDRSFSEVLESGSVGPNPVELVDERPHTTEVALAPAQKAEEFVD